MFDRELFGRRLYELRKKKKVSQTELGELLGVSGTQISDIEHGSTTTSMARLYQLCEYFQVSSDYLLGLSDDPGAKIG